MLGGEKEGKFTLRNTPGGSNGAPGSEAAAASKACTRRRVSWAFACAAEMVGEGEVRAVHASCAVPVPETARAGRPARAAEAAAPLCGRVEC